MGEKTKTLNQVPAQSPDSARAQEHGNFLSTEMKTKEGGKKGKKKNYSPNKQIIGIEQSLFSLLRFKESIYLRCGKLSWHYD